MVKVLTGLCLLTLKSLVRTNFINILLTLVMSAYKYLKVLTFMDKEEIERVYREHLEAPHLRLAQKRLAEEVVVTVHSPEALAQALKMSEALFSGDVKSLNEKEIVTLFSDVMVPLTKDIALEDALLILNAAKSKREAREFISGNSVSVNGEKSK